ncbi:MAG TPA: hypothetical protein VGH90_02425 [Chthoniobacteraceae bacterium]|jgi:hypothetical protein
MNRIHEILPVLLQCGALGQILVATLNFNLIRILKWERFLTESPLLVREVFHVHAWFISITLLIFSTFTLRFAGVMDVDPACRWMAAGIGIFWAIRTCIQIFYYDRSHWRGKAKETIIHLVLLVAYGGLAIVYLAAARGDWKG